MRGGTAAIHAFAAMVGNGAVRIQYVRSPDLGPAVIETDEVPEDEWNRMDPAVSSPLVAWLASDESQLITGQVIRAVAEDIVWMEGWSEGPRISNGGKRWDATTLGQYCCWINLYKA